MPIDSQLRLGMWRSDDYRFQSSSQRIAQIHDHGSWVRGEDKHMPAPTPADDEDDESAWEDMDSEEECRRSQMEQIRRTLGPR